MTQTTQEPREMKRDIDEDEIRLRTTWGLKKRFNTFVAKYGFKRGDHALRKLLDLAEKHPDEVIQPRVI